MIFLSGVHGVRKLHFCRLAKEATGIECYSTSELIAQKSRSNSHKISLFQILKTTNRIFFRLWLNARRLARTLFQRISRDTFATLMPKSIILLTEKPRIIAARRRIRDKVGVNEPTNEIYVTVFDKHHSRIFFLGKYSFYCAEKHKWREGVYQRPKKLRFLSSRMKRFLASAFG